MVDDSGRHIVHHTWHTASALLLRAGSRGRRCQEPDIESLSCNLPCVRCRFVSPYFGCLAPEAATQATHINQLDASLLPLLGVCISDLHLVHLAHGPLQDCGSTSGLSQGPSWDCRLTYKTTVHVTRRVKGWAPVWIGSCTKITHMPSCLLFPLARDIFTHRMIYIPAYLPQYQCMRLPRYTSRSLSTPHWGPPRGAGGSDSRPHYDFAQQDANIH